MVRKTKEGITRAVALSGEEVVYQAGRGRASRTESIIPGTGKPSQEAGVGWSMGKASDDSDSLLHENNTQEVVSAAGRCAMERRRGDGALERQKVTGHGRGEEPRCAGYGLSVLPPEPAC